MRAVLALAVLALLAVAAFGAIVPQATSSPWKIIEAWTKQMPGGNAMQINPVFDTIRSLYFTTSADGTVYALNTTSRQIVWQHKWDDIAFIQAIPEFDSILVGRSAGTDFVQASNGQIQWSNSSIIIMPDLTNHGDRNFITFIDGSGVASVIYREIGLGFTRVCSLNIAAGSRNWCDNHRVIGLPDAAYNNTFTAPLFDSKGQQYAANFDAFSGNVTWILPVDNVLTGNQDFVAVANGSQLLGLDSMTGNVTASLNIGESFHGTSTLVHSRILAVCDGQNWVAAVDMTSGNMMWNVSTPVQRGQMQLQHRGDGVLVLAVLTDSHTNFTRFDAYEGNFMWTVSARPTGVSLAPVHAWLGDDIIYVRDVTNTWSAYGVDSGSLISHGTGELFLPRSVAADFFEPHVGYFVTGPEGIVYDLKIVPRN